MHLASVDDYLGNRATRFFGEGYKRATHGLAGIESAGGGGEEAISATATVGYPADWSRKGTIDQRPHLSTIDVLLLGVQLSEVWLARHAGVGEAALRSAWIRQVHIKAGSSPVEDELEAFAVTARRTALSPSPAGPDRAVSTLACKVGSLSVRLDVDHLAGPTSGDTPGDPAGRPCGDGYRTHTQQVSDVTVAADRLSAEARVEVQVEAGAAGAGIEGDYQPAVGLIDVFVVALQLGQVLLYELDGLTRAESNTLWMRSTRWRIDAPARPVDGEHPVLVELRDAALLHNRKGETWRRADIVSGLGGIAVTCSVAHQIPATDREKD